MGRRIMTEHVSKGIKKLIEEDKRRPIVRGDDITDAMVNALDFALSQETVERGFYNANALHILNLTVVADSCDYSLDVGKNLWLNKGRWSRLIFFDEP